MAWRNVLLAASLVLLQRGFCSVRDQRHVTTKLHFIQKCIQPITKEIDSIDLNNVVDKEALLVGSQNFVNDAVLCIDYLNPGIINNTRSNEAGANLRLYRKNADAYVLWIRDNLKTDNNNKLGPNLKKAVIDFEPFVSSTKEVFAQIKQSSRNVELAVNSITNSIDNGLKSYVKLQAHMKNRKSSNADLLKNIKQVLLEAAFKALSAIASGPYNTNELVVYSRQLKNLVDNLSERINSLKSVMQHGERGAIVEEVVKKLGNVAGEIQNKVNTKLSLGLLQNMYKSWLNEISDSTEQLNKHLKGKKRACKCGLCKKRNTRYAATKLDYAQKIGPITAREVDNIDPKNKAEKEAIQIAAEHYVNGALISMKFFSSAVVNNTKSNEAGKKLEELMQNASGFFQWLQGNLQKDNPKLQANLKDGLINFGQFIPFSKDAVATLNLWPKNGELATNSLLDSIDNSAFLYIAIQGIIENRKASNTELRKTIKRLLSEAFGSLSEIPSESYNIEELLLNSRMLKRVVRQISAKVKDLQKSVPAGALNTAAKKFVQKLTKIENELPGKASSKLALGTLQNLYKSWLGDISKGTDAIDNGAAEHVEQAKKIIFDTLTIVLLYKTDFDMLAGKKL